MLEPSSLLVSSDQSATSTVSREEFSIPRANQEKTQRYPYENISALEEEHFWFVVRNERICNLITSTLPDYQNARFLEIGSGTGNVLNYLARNGFKNLTGYDVEEAGLEIARRAFPNIRFEYNDLLDKATKHEKFDAIGMFDCLEHFSDEAEPLANARSMLHPGGRIYITVPAHDFLWSKIDELFGHYRRYSKRTLGKVLAEGGFANIRQAYFMAPLVPLAIIRRKLKSYPEFQDESEIQALLDEETSLPPVIINKVMLYLTRLEHQLMGMKDFNIGGSILAVATKQ